MGPFWGIGLVVTLEGCFWATYELSEDISFSEFSKEQTGANTSSSPGGLCHKKAAILCNSSCAESGPLCCPVGLSPPHLPFCLPRIIILAWEVGLVACFSLPYLFITSIHPPIWHQVQQKVLFITIILIYLQFSEVSPIGPFTGRGGYWSSEKWQQLENGRAS